MSSIISSLLLRGGATLNVLTASRELFSRSQGAVESLTVGVMTD